MRHDPHRQADGVNRADAKLRSFTPDVDGPVWCPSCDGSGYVLDRPWVRESYGPGYKDVVQPVTCKTCGGEGLDPRVQHGGL